MRVTLCVDALGPQLSGIGRYTWELCSRLPGRSDLASVQFFGRNRLIGDPGALVRSERPARRRTIAGRFRRWRERASLQSSVVHGPNYFLPAHVAAGVVTIHDLSVFHYPEYHPASRVAEFEKRLRTSIDRADQLITDCETIRTEVINYTGCKSDRVTSVPLGVSSDFGRISREGRDAVLSRLGLPVTGYGLTISSLEPRKRIDRLLKAWRMLPRRTRDRFPLVIAGAAGWNNSALHEEIERAAAEGWAIPLGFVSESDLPAIYSGAALFAYPSIYEGFGLPPLEAMACGVPVIVAADSCLVEVTKGAAMITEPDDNAGFAQALQRGLEDNHWRDEAISAGIQVAGGYTWDECVDQTVAVYQRVSLN